MARVCELCGKGFLKGNQISHSAVKTIKRSYPNLRTVRVEIKGRTRKMKICAKCLKTQVKVEEKGNPTGTPSK
ncbi:50S ribosomal protein L28 [Candidatus Parcubacteria bacterium]|nr:50S ribosomal protein L28 [Candidatus Parcubacteria bacterium]